MVWIQISLFFLIQIVDDLSQEGDQVENNPDSGRTISSETNQKDVIPAVFEKKADLEGTLSLEAQQTDRNDVIISIKLISELIILIYLL